MRRLIRYRVVQRGVQVGESFVLEYLSDEDAEDADKDAAVAALMHEGKRVERIGEEVKG